jgi:cell division protein ZapE
MPEARLSQGVPSVSELYGVRVSEGLLQEDRSQLFFAAKLDRVLNELYGKEAARGLATKQSSLGWLFGARRAKAEPITGLYVWGTVGRGKTMLMDMFFGLAPESGKRRVHFHDFMRDVHSRIHAHRESHRAGETKQDDPIPPVAAQIVGSADGGLKLLCFDEFAITDIADAMILARLFEKLFAAGVTVIATSNVPPRQLYKDGINRDRFLPFIDLLETYTETVALDSTLSEQGIDYRRQKVEQGEVWFSPLGQNTDAALDRLWLEWTAQEPKPEEKARITVHGRTLTLKDHLGGYIRSDFAELCERPLGAHDYLALTDLCHTLFLERVPVITAERRNEAKRLITLIDTLYDTGKRLVVSAEAEPWDIYAANHGTEGFEFERTASRLTEMRSADWQKRWLESSGLSAAQ